jgi:predicted Rossmann fold flavoprotein
MKFDIIIIGGGSAGLMAAIAASDHGANVLLLDKRDKLGRKLGISGGGRCNVTNNKEMDELIKHIPGNGRFLYSALANFGNKDIIAFFERLGIRLKEEDHGRMFPVTDKAKTVVDALVNQVVKQGVTIGVNSPVADVLYADGAVAGVRLRSGERIAAKAVIVASGGKSVPHTGSTGDGYVWAEQGGHTITELFPTEVPIVSNEPFIVSKELQGVSLRDVSLSVWNPKGKRIIEHRGDMLFTIRRRQHYSNDRPAPGPNGGRNLQRNAYACFIRIEESNQERAAWLSAG